MYPKGRTKPRLRWVVKPQPSAAAPSAAPDTNKPEYSIATRLGIAALGALGHGKQLHKDVSKFMNGSRAQHGFMEAASQAAHASVDNPIVSLSGLYGVALLAVVKWRRAKERERNEKDQEGLASALYAHPHERLVSALDAHPQERLVSALDAHPQERLVSALDAQPQERLASALAASPPSPTPDTFSP